MTAPLIIDVRRPIMVGLGIVLIGFGGFLAWAAFAPLTSAAIAPGMVVADSRNKPIQHLEGGIIREVLVREGDEVKAGAVLARLDSAVAEASLGRLEAARRESLALAARLGAERDGAEEITFPAELVAPDADADTVEAVRGQQSLFITRRTAYESERRIIEQRISQYQQEIRGIEAQVASEERQLALTEEELVAVRSMVAKDLEGKPRLLALERTAAALNGARGEHVADIARVRQNIAEMQERMVNLRAKRLDETAGELREVQVKLIDLAQQIGAASDASRRLEVRAPVSGRIVSVFHESPGGVVKPGETLMELLPGQDLLVVEAHVRPEDIDSVARDQKVRVRLTAYSQRRTPALQGRVHDVSADRILDQKGEKSYYLARVMVDTRELEAQQSLRLYPGMPATVFIETHQETLLDYLLSPLFGAFERGMREH
jgi:HlyD family secretion protein/epimerase transport system membrane fusion protein